MIYEFDIDACVRVMATVNEETEEAALDRLLELLPESFQHAVGLRHAEGIGVVIEKLKIKQNNGKNK